MDTNKIIEQIDQEIARLQRAKSELNGAPAVRGPGRPKKIVLFSAPHKSITKKPRAKDVSPSSPRVMSAEGKARIAAAQKLRWAKSKKAAKKAAKAQKAAATSPVSE